MPSVKIWSGIVGMPHSFLFRVLRYLTMRHHVYVSFLILLALAINTIGCESHNRSLYLGLRDRR